MFLLLICISCTKPQYLREEGMVWNTAYHITYESGVSLQDSILKILDEIDFSLSPFNRDSNLSKINDNRTDNADDHFKKVYAESKRIKASSHDIFDPTLGPVIRAWGFGEGHEVSSDTLRLDSLMQLVGIEKTALHGNSLYKENPNIEFNFSAIAKGYGVDCIADMFERNGVTNYLVEIGGEIRASGVNPKNTTWKIGIDRPDADASIGETVEVIEVENIALATSGNYRNYHDAEGKRFGHTISPVTLRPVETDVISASVTASSCMEADALATCCMALGSKKALSLCDSLNAGVLLILQDFSVIRNSRFP